MARKSSQSDPALAIEFWLSGFYTHRSQLFAPFKGIGVNVVSFHDPVIDGQNMEDTDLFEWTRRPGFSIFCPTALADTEIINQFYDMRNLDGEVIDMFDSTLRMASFNSTGLTPIITKTTTEQGYISAVGNIAYFSDGAAADMQVWDTVEPLSTINPFPWGLPAPTLTPTIFNHGCWLQFTEFAINNAILDPNGCVEVVTAIFGASGVSGGNEPIWPTTTSSTVSDGSIQWTNMGSLAIWYPATYYPVPVVVLDTNGNLQLATATTPTVIAWDSSTTYAVGVTVSFAGTYWTSLVASTNQAPSANTTVTTTSGSTATTQPYWVPATNPSATGIYPTTPYVPTWNTAIGGTTADGNYTWTNLGPGNLVESFGTSYVYCWRTIYGHLSTASPISVNTGSIFGPVISTITGFSISDNVVTFLGTNNFVPGNVFSVQGLSTGTYLNNLPFIVLASGLSPTEFSAVFDYPDISATIDSGSTLNLIATVTGVGNSSPLCNAAYAISASMVLDGVVTLYSVNDFVPGLQVTFTGLTIATFLNNAQFEIINVDPDGQWFQVYYTTTLGVVPPNQAQTTDTGTATFNSVEIYRLSDGGGIYLFVGAISNPTGTTILPYDSGSVTAMLGSDDGVPGTYPWVDPDNVTGTSAYATVDLPAPSGSGAARFTVVQKGQAYSAPPSTPITSLGMSFVNPVTAGNSILVCLTTYHVQTWAMTDSQGNTYTQIAQAAYEVQTGVYVTQTIYLATNVSGGSTTVTLRLSGTQTNAAFFQFNASECSGLVGTVGTVVSQVQATGTTLDPGFLATAPNNVLITSLWSDLGTNSSLVAAPPVGFSRIIGQVTLDPTGTNFGGSYLQMESAYSTQQTSDSTWSTPANKSGIGISLLLPLTVYQNSDGLDAQTFDLAVPPNIAISGIEIDFDALFSGGLGYGTLQVQLLRAGNPVGSILFVTPTASSVNYTLGGTNTLWGTTWSASDVNSPTWGVRIIAAQATGGTIGTFSVNNVRARITGSTSTTGWVFNDFVPDNDLDIEQIAPQNHLNDPPPGAPGSSVNQVVGTVTKYWQGRLWMAVGNYVYFDAGPDCENGDPQQSWPPANRFQFAGPVMNLEETADGVGLLVFLADRVNAILGGPETISFYPTDALSNLGISNPNAIFRDGSTIGMFTTQKQYLELIDDRRSDTGDHVADYLAANFTAAQSYVTMHRDGTDVGVFISNGVDQVLRFGSNIQAWSVPAYPVGGAGALRSIETSVGIHTLMLASPTGGTSGATAPIVPGLGTSISPATYYNYTMTGSGFVATWSMLLGQSPTVYGIGNNTSFAGIALVVNGTPYTDEITFFNLSEEGGLSTIASHLPDVDGAQLYSGPESNPILLTGTFALVALVGGADYSLVVSPPISWTSPNNITNGSPTSYASLVIPTNGVTSTMLHASTYPFNLPASAIIQGVSVAVTGKQAVPGGTPFTITPLNPITGSESDSFGLGTTGSILDKHTTSVGTSGTITTPALVPSGANDFALFAVYDLESTGDLTPGGLWSTIQSGQSPYNFGLFNQTVSASVSGYATDDGTITNTQAALTLFSSNGSPVIVQNETGQGLASEEFGSNVTAGNAIIVTFWAYGLSGSIPATATCANGGDTFTQISSVSSGTNPGGQIFTFYCASSIGGSGVKTVTVTPSAGLTTYNITILEVSGLAGVVSNTTVTFGGPSDLWGTPSWASPAVVNSSDFGFAISVAELANTYEVSEVNVTVYYQNPSNYILGRDLTTWSDNGFYGQNNGTFYNDCYITVGSITLSQPGAPLFPLQHVVGYFDAVGTLNNGGPSQPNIWILPNEINDTQGIGFIQLPEVGQEPPTGQNQPSASLLALRWPLTAMNSNIASQYVHHLQVKIDFSPESAPNTIKCLAFKENQND